MWRRKGIFYWSLNLAVIIFVLYSSKPQSQFKILISRNRSYCLQRMWFVSLMFDLKSVFKQESEKQYHFVKKQLRVTISHPCARSTAKPVLKTENKLWLQLMGAPEENSESLHQSSINTAIFALTTMSSLSGNSVVCFAFYRNRRLRTITNFYILSLALADMMVAVFVFPFGTIAYGLGTWPFSHNYCQFTGFLSLFWAEVSLCIMALTSINRYLCVVKPRMYRVLFTKKKTISSILWFWICSFIMFLV